jgi:hypothetical protein
LHASQGGPCRFPCRRARPQGPSFVSPPHSHDGSLRLRISAVNTILVSLGSRSARPNPGVCKHVADGPQAPPTAGGCPPASINSPCAGLACVWAPQGRCGELHPTPSGEQKITKNRHEVGGSVDQREWRDGGARLHTSRDRYAWDVCESAWPSDEGIGRTRGQLRVKFWAFSPHTVCLGVGEE